MDYREKIVHGNEELPVAIYNITPKHIRYHMDVHWHPEHEILLVCEGSIRVRLNETTYHLTKDDVLFIPGGTIHSAEPENCHYSCILTNLSLLVKKSDACMPYAERISSGEVTVHTKLSESDPHFAQLCHEMLDVHQAGSEGYPFEIKGLIHLFFGRIFRMGYYTKQATDKNASRKLSGRMKNVITYIQEHYNSPLRLDMLAALVNLSPNHFCRSFRSITGQTPFEYIQAYRLSKARYALISTEMTVTEVALECGFNDTSHFIRLFREAYGTTPKQFRLQQEAL